MENPEKLET